MSAPPPSSPRSYVRQSGVIVPVRATLGGRVAARAVFLLVRSVDATLRYHTHIPPATQEAFRTGPAIFAIWHNRLALSLRLYQRFVRPHRPGARMAAIVSASRDGGLLARVLELFDVEPVRGSSSRRGPQAMLELRSWAERGLDLAVTPDGPRGPRYVVQDGVVAAAQLTGLPVIPTSFSLGWKRELKSWDRFQLPLPGSRVDVRLANPVHVPRDADDAERTRCRQLIEDQLRAVTVD